MQTPVREFMERHLAPHLIRFHLLLFLLEATVREQTTPGKISGRHGYELKIFDLYLY
jgi:hypothetical protein